MNQPQNAAAMTAIFDMTRRVTMHDTVDADAFRNQIESGSGDDGGDDFDQHFGISSDAQRRQSVAACVLGFHLGFTDKI